MSNSKPSSPGQKPPSPGSKPRKAPSIKVLGAGGVEQPFPFPLERRDSSRRGSSPRRENSRRSSAMSKMAPPGTPRIKRPSPRHFVSPAVCIVLLNASVDTDETLSMLHQCILSVQESSANIFGLIRLYVEFTNGTVLQLRWRYRTPRTFRAFKNRFGQFWTTVHLDWQRKPRKEPTEGEPPTVPRHEWCSRKMFSLKHHIRHKCYQNLIEITVK